MINFDESNWEADMLGNWLPKYVFIWFDIQGKDATGERGCWEGMPARKRDGRRAGEGHGWKYSTHLLLYVIVIVTCYSMQLEEPWEAWGKQGCLR